MFPSRLFLILVLWLPAVFLHPSSIRAQDSPAWSGSVLDLVGVGIPGVEILAYPAGQDSSGLPPGIFRSDDRGRFRLSGLTPGRHFLALNKPGYQVLLAQVNTRWISRLTLTLIPGGPGILPPYGAPVNSMDWVLRAPRTDLLKEIRGGMPEAAASKGPERSVPGQDLPGPILTGSPSSDRLPFNGEVEQWFTTDPSFAWGGADTATSSGRTTVVRFDGGLLGRGNWKVGGILGTLSTGEGQVSSAGGERDEGAGRLRVAMDYELSPEDSIRFQARYDRDSFRSGSPADRLTPAEQEVRTLGYQAGWIRKMEQGGGLEMNMGFVQALGRTPGDFPGPDPLPGSERDSLLQDRLWNAGALYGFIVSPEHRVLVRARTRFYRYEQRNDGWVLAPVHPDLSSQEAGERGWSVSISGEDAWKISDPFSLTLGLDYHRAGSPEVFSVFVPRLGARREGKRSLIQGQILLRLETPAAVYGDSPAAGSASSGESSLGYRAEILQRLGGSWVVAGHAERNPLISDEGNGWLDPGGLTDPAGLLLADPDSMTEEIGIQVTRRLKGLEGTLGTDQGRVRGRVAARLDGAPIRLLGEGDVHYVTLKASASVPRTDTEVRFNYRVLDHLETSPGSVETGQAARIDLTVLQQIPLLAKRLPADWRLLLAYQTLTWDAAESEEALMGPSTEKVRRLSGGVGVKF